jgi:hypothetical protein
VKLPNPQEAIVDIKKLRDYCLDLKHPRGRHKARVFARVLGITFRDAELLHSALLRAAVQNEAILGRRDAFGQRYVLDFELQGPLGKGSIRSCWIVLANEGFPRMTTCYVL